MSATGWAAGDRRPPPAAQHFPADEDLEFMRRYLVEDGETPGAVLGVLEADGSTRIISRGSAGPGAGPPGPRTVFEIGSITKTFTATLATLHAQEEGHRVRRAQFEENLLARLQDPEFTGDISLSWPTDSGGISRKLPRSCYQT